MINTWEKQGAYIASTGKLQLYIFWQHDLNIWDWTQLHEPLLERKIAAIDVDFNIDGKQFMKFYFC